MTDENETLLKNFFKEAARQQIEDDGFTERVMRDLDVLDRTSQPLSLSTSQHFCRLWTWFCVAVGGLLFFFLNGWEALKASLSMLLTMGMTSLEVFLTTVPTADLRLNPVLVLLLVAFVTIYLPYRTARRLSSVL